MKPADEASEGLVQVERYDRLQSLYLTTGDFSALQQMNTGYPQQTRTLIEDVLKIGRVNEPEINVKFLNFYQDTTLQSLIASSEQAFANMDDINEELSEAFSRLQNMIPGIKLPQIYAQIGSLDQSIIVGDGTLGISLDKYMGVNYPLYKKHYTLQQRESMTRQNIIPDCLSFYLLSLYPLDNFDRRSQQERDFHMGKMMWICNQVLGRKFYKMKFVDEVANYQKKHNLTIMQLLEDTP
jgi:hypothetical protein